MLLQCLLVCRHFKKSRFLSPVSQNTSEVYYFVLLSQQSSPRDSPSLQAATSKQIVQEKAEELFMNGVWSEQNGLIYEGKAFFFSFVIFFIKNVTRQTSCWWIMKWCKFGAKWKKVEIRQMVSFFCIDDDSLLHWCITLILGYKWSCIIYCAFGFNKS